MASRQERININIRNLDIETLAIAAFINKIKPIIGVMAIALACSCSVIGVERGVQKLIEGYDFFPSGSITGFLPKPQSNQQFEIVTATPSLSNPIPNNPDVKPAEVQAEVEIPTPFPTPNNKEEEILSNPYDPLVTFFSKIFEASQEKAVPMSRLLVKNNKTGETGLLTENFSSLYEKMSKQSNLPQEIKEKMKEIMLFLLQKEDILSEAKAGQSPLILLMSQVNLLSQLCAENPQCDDKLIKIFLRDLQEYLPFATSLSMSSSTESLPKEPPLSQGQNQSPIQTSIQPPPKIQPENYLPNNPPTPTATPKPTATLDLVATAQSLEKEKSQKLPESSYQQRPSTPYLPVIMKGIKDKATPYPTTYPTSYPTFSIPYLPLIMKGIEDEKIGTPTTH